MQPELRALPSWLPFADARLCPIASGGFPQHATPASGGTVAGFEPRHPIQSRVDSGGNRMRAGLRLVVLAALAVAATSAAAADRIRLAVQKTGTLAWELDVIRTHGIDRKLDLQIDTVELASTEAGKIALKSGSADLMLSDW